MDEVLELTLTIADGILDCRLEPQRNDGNLSYSVTILYPDFSNGYNRSEVFCYTLSMDTINGNYFFEEHEGAIHPKIKKLELQISDAVIKARKEAR